MDQFLRVILFAFACTVLSGLYCGWGRDQDSTRTGSSGQVQSVNGTIPNDESERRLRLWKSCADLIHPNGGYSIVELQTLFERPRDTRQFLENLKVAWERGLLLRPSFYDEATLLKFFNGRKVTWNRPDPLFNNPHTEIIAGSVASNAFPEIMVNFSSNCSVIDYKDADGGTLSNVAGNGFLSAEIGSVPEMTLQAVRSVFGHESGQSIDRGIDPHGNTYVTTEKGSVVYTIVPKDAAASSRIELTFYFRLAALQPGVARPSDKLVDDDRVTRISMHDVQGHTVGNR